MDIFNTCIVSFLKLFFRVFHKTYSENNTIEETAFEIYFFVIIKLFNSR